MTATDGAQTTVVLAYDDSRSARHALRAFSELAPKRYTLTVVNVLEFGDDPAAERDQERLLAVAGKRAQEVGLDAELLARRGLPGDEILALCDELGATLLVIGARGAFVPIHGSTASRLGSVAKTLLERAPLDVLVAS